MKNLQHLLIKDLLKDGSVQLLLPDGITLEIGIVQDDKMGKKQKTDDYCYVVVKRDGKSIVLDSYTLGMSFQEDGSFVFKNTEINENGIKEQYFDVV